MQPPGDCFCSIPVKSVATFAGFRQRNSHCVCLCTQQQWSCIITIIDTNTTTIIIVITINSHRVSSSHSFDSNETTNQTKPHTDTNSTKPIYSSYSTTRTQQNASHLGLGRRINRIARSLRGLVHAEGGELELGIIVHHSTIGSQTRAPSFWQEREQIHSTIFKDQQIENLAYRSTDCRPVKMRRFARSCWSSLFNEKTSSGVKCD